MAALNKNKKNYYISTDKALLNISFIHQFIANESYWAKNIPKNLLKKSIENSMCFGVYLNTQQVGFARVITDFATFGYLADLFIDKQHQKIGLSKLLMHTIISHPKLIGLRRMALFTKDAHSLYKQFGFNAGKTPENYMEIKLENSYTSK
jgi:N-acetylglutamate synthase-like GNAT family acetyltransferase